MASSVIHPFQWSTPDTQYFLTFNGESDELHLHESVLSKAGYSNNRSSIPPSSSAKNIQCFDYSPIDKGLVAVGSSSGDVTIENLLTDRKPLLIRSTPSDRCCNAVSFNTTGLVASGYDKVRSSFSLKVYDTHQVFKGQPAEVYSTVPGELARSTAFVPDEPNSLLCGSYKFLRGFDIRTDLSVFSFGTTYLEGVTIDPLNSNYFATHNDKGNVRVWDRRRMAAGGSSSDFLLSINPFGEKCDFWNFRLSNSRPGEFAFLNPTGTGIKRWQSGYVPGFSRDKHFSNHANHSEFSSSTNLNLIHDTDVKTHSHLFVSAISQTKILEKGLSKSNEKEIQNPVISFDYVPDLRNPSHLNFICLHEDGSLFRLNAVDASSAVRFDPHNVVAIAENSHVVFQKPHNTSFSLENSQTMTALGSHGEMLNPTHRGSDLTGSLIFDETLNDESEFGDESFDGSTGSPIHMIRSNISESLLHSVEYTLERDISVTIRKMVMNGYSMDCEKNVEILQSSVPEFSRRDKLISAWQWIGRAKKGRSQLVSGSVDFSFEGVMGIWRGYEWISKRVKNVNFTQKAFDAAVIKILGALEMGNKKRIFTMVSQTNQSKRNLRQLCLRAAGWTFDESQLEPMLQQYETEGQYEKAAGWAVFHGNVNRAVQSLAKSKSPKHRMMSAAIAGYDGYKRTTMNTPWKDLCRNMATSLDNPYMRAVFGFISDGDWSEVLEEGSLPLNERLGIALRFYKDNELSIYLKKLTANVIRNGDIDGVILTGLTPMALDLFQSYVDKTVDVQTASLAISFAYPLYFQDERPSHWIECYRTLLNSWKLYSKRSMFDIARARASRTTDGRLTAKISPRQVYLSCHNCKGIIGDEAVSFSSAKPTNSGPGMTGPLVGRVNSNLDSFSGSNNMFTKPGPVLSIPPQQYALSQLKANNDAANSNVRCPHCNYPLPRCAVCLLPLGSMPPRMGNDNSLESFKHLSIGNSGVDSKHAATSIHPAVNDDSIGPTDKPESPQPVTTHAPGALPSNAMQNKFDRYFVFCLSCSHGMHAGHARQWFAKHALCAVPDCDCPCTKYQL